MRIQPPAEGESEIQEDAEKQELTVEDGKNKHGFLILSREDSTMVGNGDFRSLPEQHELHTDCVVNFVCVCGQILQTGQEIMELDTSGFATQGPTVYAGNIGDDKYIIQVSPMGIRLLEGGETHIR